MIRIQKQQRPSSQLSKKKMDGTHTFHFVYSVQTVFNAFTREVGFLTVLHRPEMSSHRSSPREGHETPDPKRIRSLRNCGTSAFNHATPRPDSDGSNQDNSEDEPLA